MKYGIDLIELRRANQMWANDTIHLRETIFIPLHRASRAQEYIVRPQVSSTPGSSSASSSMQSDNELDTPASPAATNVRRVPVSQLSYFPPPSNTYRSNLAAGLAPPPVGRLTSHTKPPPRNQPTPNQSLTSLLNAFPIGASTRDEIASRLSLDSTTSSFSERRSRTSFEENTGHEMDNVNGPGLPIDHRRRSPELHSDTQQTPRISQRPKGIAGRETSGKGRSPDLGKSHPAHTRINLSTSPSSYVPQTHNPYVRTSQMEPSPGMKLPLVRSSSESYTPSTVTKNNRRPDVKHHQYASDNGRLDVGNGNSHHPSSAYGPPT